jgi:hypothetical protein
MEIEGGGPAEVAKLPDRAVALNPRSLVVGGFDRGCLPALHKA